MLVVVPVLPAAFPDRAQRALFLRTLLEAPIAQNRALIQQGLLPPLYKSGVRFAPEPWSPTFDEFAPAPLVIKRGHGDCDDLVAWRVAELRERGELGAGVKIYWRVEKRPDGSTLTKMHAEVRRADGSVEDVARMLGMGSDR